MFPLGLRYLPDIVSPGSVLRAPYCFPRVFYLPDSFPWVCVICPIVSPGSVLLARYCFSLGLLLAPYCFPWVFYLPHSFPLGLLLAPYCCPLGLCYLPHIVAPWVFSVVQSSQNTIIRPHTFVADLGQPSDYGVKKTSLF